MSTPAPIPYNPLATTPGLIRRFQNPKTQAALDMGIAEMDPADKVGVIVHHVFDTAGNVIQNETKASIVVKIGGGFSIMAAGYKDWTKPGFGVEGKLIWKL